MTEPYPDISNLLYANETNATDSNFTIFINEDLERFVSITVFILFSFIFIAGLIGNGLVVMGKGRRAWKTFNAINMIRSISSCGS